MARLTSWLSPDVLHALGWTLIHSVWQCLALAALAAVFMAVSRRPAIRYLTATGALVAMLAAPAATFLVLMKPVTPVQVPALPGLALRLPVARATVDPPDAMATPLGAASAPTNNDVAIALVDSRNNSFPPRLLSWNFLPPNILPWLVAAWLCGVALFSLRFAGGFLLLEQKRRRQSKVPGPRILALCQALQCQLGLSRAIRYLECGWLQSPAVIGWIRPIVLLPVTALTGLTDEQLRAVIAHELAHIRRHDFFVNLLQILVETLLFYHPAIWWLNRRIRIERELCCDEIAVSLTGDRLEYVKALILMEEWEQAPALAMAANRSPLSERVFHILDRKPFCAGQRMLGLTGSILFLAAALGAANALFGIALPIPAARAEASIKALPSPNEIAVDHAIDHTAPTVPQPSKLAAKDVSPDQSGNRGTGQETIRLVRTAAANSQAEKLLAQPLDPSQLLPKTALVSSASVASKEPPIAPARPASNPSPAAVMALNDRSGVSNSAQPVQPKAVEYAPPGLINSLAMEEVPDSDTMTVTAVIDGHPEKLLVGIADTTQLWNTQARQLGLPVRPGRRMMDGGGRFSDQVTRVARLTLGSMETGGFDLQVSPDPDFENPASGGILGTDMMMRYDIDLDFAHRRLNYFSPEQCKDACIYWAPSKISSVRMAAYARVVYVPVTLDGHTIIAALDTAADRTFLNPKLAAKLFGLEPDSQEATTIRDSGAVIKAGIHAFSSLTLGGLTINNPQIAIPFDVSTQNTREFHANRMIANRYPLSEFLPPMIIGMDVLKQSHLYISFQNQRIYVSAAGDGPALNPGPIKTSWFNVWKYGYDTYLQTLHMQFGL